MTGTGRIAGITLRKVTNPHNPYKATSSLPRFALKPAKLFSDSSAVRVSGAGSTTRGYWPQRLDAKAGDVDLPARYLTLDLAELNIPVTTTTVRLGEKQFQSVPTVLHTTPIFRGEGGLLGNGLLRQFKLVTLDTKAGKLILSGETPTP